MLQQFQQSSYITYSGSKIKHLLIIHQLKISVTNVIRIEYLKKSKKFDNYLGGSI